MIQTIDLRGTRPTPAELLAAVPRALTDVTSASAVAAELIDDVRARGEAALLDQAERLDRVRPDQVRVPASHIAEALAGLEPAVRTAIEETIRRVRLASAAQVPPRIDTTIAEGAVITQRWQPINRVGLYVPGGEARAIDDTPATCAGTTFMTTLDG
jgi:histidinol dehydrogenase